MAQEERNRIAEWYEILRSQLPILRQHVVEWASNVREEPHLLWESAIVRIVAVILGGLILLWGAQMTVNLLVPPAPASAGEQATSADFHVVCQRPECGAHFVIHRALGFSDFPVTCPRCKQKSGVRALRCNSDACKGRWVAPVDSNGVQICPQCGRQLN